VTLAKEGWAAGPKVMFPPVDANLYFFKTRLEVEAGAGLGSNGMWSVQLGAGTRWK
jgi:hypothetical protein